MKVPVATTALLLAVFCLAAGAQPTPPPQMPAASTSAAGGMTESEADVYPEARTNADSLREAWAKLDTASMTEVNRLLKQTKVCQELRVNGLIGRTREALDSWLAAEKGYWSAWNEHESKRVAELQKGLASMETDLTRLSELVENDKQDHEKLLRSKANLENTPRTESIKKDIDNLLTEIESTDARLANDEQQFKELTTKYENMKILISARLSDIRANIVRIDAYALDEHAVYEKQQEAAHEICNVKQPTTKPALPKKDGGK